MAIYEIKSDRIAQIQETSFDKVGLKERQDLQRLIRSQIEIISDELLVIAEEFGDWEDSRRRIDLLALDVNANLVVIELKRTDDGGHMELQAIRYAAMVSTMTFDKAKEVYSHHLSKMKSEIEAEKSLLQFLKWEEVDEDAFGQDVRMILVSADFSKELTTSVIWLNQYGIDLKCVRIKPYLDGGRVLIDVQQVLPLPEAEDYTISIREKVSKERLDRAIKGPRHQLRKEFWIGLVDRAQGKLDLFAHLSPSEDNWLSAGSGISNFVFQFIIRKSDGSVQFSMEASRDVNKLAFDFLSERRQQIEDAFGGELAWNRLNERNKSHINQVLRFGGIHSEKDAWPKIQDSLIASMARFVSAFSPHIEELRSYLKNVSSDSIDI